MRRRVLCSRIRSICEWTAVIEGFLAVVGVLVGMSKEIVFIGKDSSPVPPIFTFEFADGTLVAVAKNVADRHSEYDGRLFSAWETKRKYVETSEEISGADVPDKLTSGECYVQEDDGWLTDEHLAAIESV